jgi:hypothetical protein
MLIRILPIEMTLPNLDGRSNIKKSILENRDDSKNDTHKTIR